MVVRKKKEPTRKEVILWLHNWGRWHEVGAPIGPALEPVRLNWDAYLEKQPGDAQARIRLQIAQIAEYGVNPLNFALSDFEAEQQNTDVDNDRAEYIESLLQMLALKPFERLLLTRYKTGFTQEQAAAKLRMKFSQFRTEHDKAIALLQAAMVINPYQE